MHAHDLIDRLQANAAVIERLVHGVPDRQARWRPVPERWSILDVTAHLLDEEREDFRLRLDLLLRDPTTPWPAIDPAGWVTARNYAERDLTESLSSFLDERDASIAWLRGLPSPDWETAYTHAKLGGIRAGDLLASWVGHDLLHVRQLARLHWEYLKRLTDPYAPAYAGEW
jgi:hypothetical protein